MIQIENASFRYTRMDTGVTDISLAVSPGECVLLCGPSGCGKTTLTRMVNGLIPHFYQGDFSGRVKVAGLSVADAPLHRIAGCVGSVFQNPRTQFFNVDTDGEMAFSLENAGVDPETICRKMARTTRDLNLEPLLGRSLFELSGGEKQKIAFASAYAFSPSIFVLDEPSANLDPDSIRTLKKYLALLKAQGKTIIIAEHRLYYLMGLADRIIYMDCGTIKARYSSDEFMAIPEKELASMGLRSRTPGAYPKSLFAPHNPKTQKKLVIESMSARYKKEPVIENISLTARSGQIIGLVGGNGAGKSTFIRTLAGLHKKERSRITWQGRPVSAKKRLAASYLVMQDTGFQLFAESVTRECMFGLKNPDTGLIKETLENLGLAPLGKRHPHTLSGGQKQRLAIAAAMACGKEILLFDEPTSGLDYGSMLRVRNLFYDLAARNKLIFVISHDYEFLGAVCSRIIRLHQGRIVKDYICPGTDF